MESNQQNQSIPALTQSERLNRQLVDWMEHLDKLVENGAEQEQLDYCNQQLDRLTQALQAEAGQ